jgi:hypothetical protein
MLNDVAEQGWRRTVFRGGQSGSKLLASHSQSPRGSRLGAHDDRHAADGAEGGVSPGGESGAERKDDPGAFVVQRGLVDQLSEISRERVDRRRLGEREPRIAGHQKEVVRESDRNPFSVIGQLVRQVEDHLAAGGAQADIQQRQPSGGAPDHKALRSVT